MAFTYDHVQNVITVDQATVDVQTLLNTTRQHESGGLGIRYKQIAGASGQESLGGGVSVGLTVELLNSWQLKFTPGNYIAKISGGNLVGGINGDPVAYSAGVQVLLIQSAASTVVSVGGSALTTEEHDILVSANDAAVLTRKHTTNKAVISQDDLETTIFDDDNITELSVFDISADKKTRTPQ